MLDLDTTSDDRWRDDGGHAASRREDALSSTIRYPVYVIHNDRGILIAHSSSKECVLLFHRKELAERHIAAANVVGRLSPLAVPDAESLREGLAGLPASVTCAIWDATGLPGTFSYVRVSELLRAIGD